MPIKKPENNPLLEPTPYRNDVPPFDLVKTEHFLPALEWAISDTKRELEEIKNIKNPSFENIIEAMDKDNKSFSRVMGVFSLFDGANNTDELKAISGEFKGKISKFYTDISLDEDLFKQTKAVYDKKDSLNLSKAQLLLLEDQYKGFVRNGALLNDEDKQKFRNNSERQAELKNEFGQNSLNAINEFEYYVEDESELAGMPEGARTAATEAAEEKGQQGKWLLTLHAPSVIPVLQYAENRDLREKIWRAYSTVSKDGEHDNKQVLKELVTLRNERAQLLGYDTHADYVLEERMAKNKDTVFEMLDNYKEIVKPFAEKEHKELQDFAKSTGATDELKPWDMGFYATKMKQEKYSFDEEELKPFLSFEKVRQGAFDVATKLYDIRFEKKDDYPVYHEDVETFDVYNNKTNELVGVFYTDYFPRATKRGGAWMDAYVSQSHFDDGSRKPPVIGNHGNFPKPTKDKPSLLSMNDAITLFHEFGHGLHGLMSNTEYQSHASPNVRWDFVELPSQLMENFVKEKEVLDMFAKHFETDKNIPADLLQKMKDAENFRSASNFLRQIQLATLDMKWHTTDPSTINDVEAFEREVCNDFYMVNPEGGLTSTAFSHIFDGGYSAGYYSYKWAEVLEADAFEPFKENGLFDKETADKFHTLIASGGSVEPDELYLNFRGKPADPSALLKREGLDGNPNDINDNKPQQAQTKKKGFRP